VLRGAIDSELFTQTRTAGKVDDGEGRGSETADDTDARKREALHLLGRDHPDGMVMKLRIWYCRQKEL
jgi:hypothetical protein